MPVMDFGGVESRIITQAGLMDRERYDFRVLTFWKKGAAAKSVEALGIPVDDLGEDPNPRNPKALLRLVEYVMSRDVDVVHASILEANVQAAMLRAVPGAPSVAIEEVGMPQRAFHSRLAFGAAYRLADVVVGVSQKACEAVKAQHWLPSRQVRLIYNAINPRFLEPTVPAPNAGPLRLVAVGRLVEVKNQEVLLRAMRRIPVDRRPTLHLIGEGPLRARLEQRIGELELQESVSLRGFQSDVRAVLDDADGYLMPSFSEGTSISLAEAMARGRPVLTSRADGIDEAMAGYPPGWQLATDDVEGWARGIQRLGELGADGRAALGSEARALVSRRMSPETWRRELECLYDELAAATLARRAGLSARVARALGRLASRVRA